MFTLCALACSSLFSSCTSDSEPEINSGVGGITLTLKTDGGFQSTKAVNEADYKETSDYQVQIYKDGISSPVKDVTYQELVSEINADELKRLRLGNGAYTLKAFKGEDKAASTSTMYVYGEQSFSVNNDFETVEVTCKPVCARVKVVFDSSMATYFSDYSVVFETKAMGETTYTWKKAQEDAVYLKVDEKESVKATINLTNTSGKTSTIDKTYTLSPKQALIINVKPVVKSGSIGIEISIDESTNDIPVDIEIPSDWK